MHDVTDFSGKVFATLRARAARCGVLTFRSDASDGAVVFFIVAGGKLALMPTLAALADAVDRLEAELEVRHAH